MIKLYYVRGINLVDTPYFNSIEEQEEYFDNKLVNTIDAIYPPHYTNRINFSNEDLDFDTKVNYLSLEFNGKTYYYFISDMRYIAEDLISIDITMDTFQTYMFDIIYHNARVERELINRWNSDGTINRNYIRENYSSNIYELKNYNEINVTNKTDLYYLVFKRAYKLTDLFTPNTPSFFSDNNRTVVPNEQIWIVPIPRFFIGRLDNYKYDYNFNGQTISTTLANIITSNVFLGLFNDPNVIEAYYLKYLSLDIRYTVSEEIENGETIYRYTFTRDLGSYEIHNGVIFVNTGFFNREIYNVDLPFNRSLFDNALFNYHYIPQLIDSNYIEFRYGERLQSTTFPLEKMTTTRLSCLKYIDISTGTRCYWINNQDSYKDRYLTIINNDSKEYITLYTDAWRNYLANNIGTLTLGTLLETANAATTIASGGLSLYKGGTTLSRVKREKYGGRLTKGVVKGRQEQVSGLSDIASGAEDLGQVGVNYLNKLFAPNKVKQGNNYTADFVTDALQEIYTISYASNIENVATVYESIGYLVDKFVSGNPIQLNRSIYNFIKCSEIDLEITLLSSLDINEDIENRFINGLRLWNVTEMESLNLSLGDVCVYDNKEIEEVVINE